MSNTLGSDALARHLNERIRHLREALQAIESGAVWGAGSREMAKKARLQDEFLVSDVVGLYGVDHE